MITKRNIALCIIFCFITCGIYGIYWFICLTNEVNALSKEGGTSGVLAFIFTVITCGLYGFYWAYKMGEKLDKAKQRHSSN